jgi:hypothetical protein
MRVAETEPEVGRQMLCSELVEPRRVMRGFVLAGRLCQNDSVPFACFQNETGGIAIGFSDFSSNDAQRAFRRGEGKRK